MPTASGFQLFDSQANAVESGKEYFLKLANPELEYEVLSFEYLNVLHGTIDCGEPIVTCEFIDGIAYLKYNNEFLYFTPTSDSGITEIGLTGDIPKKHERLRLVKSEEDNTFQISKWDRDIFANIYWVKCSYAAVNIQERRGDVGGMRLILSPL